MNVLRLLITVAVMAFGASVNAQVESSSRWKGWCDYSWNPAGAPPPRLNLPAWACEAAFNQGLNKRFSIYTRINPFFLSGDFNGDGRNDVAIWVTNSRTRQRGIVILHQGAGVAAVIGAGVALSKGMEDYSVFDMWTVIPKGAVLDAVFDGQEKRTLTGDALEVTKSDASSHAVYWDGAKYSTYTLGE